NIAKSANHKKSQRSPRDLTATESLLRMDPVVVSHRLMPRAVLTPPFSSSLRPSWAHAAKSSIHVQTAGFSSRVLLIAVALVVVVGVAYVLFLAPQPANPTADAHGPAPVEHPVAAASSDDS